jgi:hypothetical protein
MSLYDLENSKKLKKLKLTRQEIAERSLEICKHAIEDGSYKNAVGVIGRMKALGQAIDDCYWEEKRDKGYELELYMLLSKIKLPIEPII